MKHFFILLIGFCLWMALPLVVSGQTAKTNLKGDVSNPQRDFFLLKHQGRTDTVKLNAEGKFDLFIEQNTANYFTIDYNRQSLLIYLLPSDNVTLSISGVNITDSKITGSSATYCNHILQRAKDDRAFSAAYPTFKLGSLSAERYFLLRDSVRNVRLNTLAANNKTSNFNAQFRETEEKIYTYQMALDLINYKNQSMKSGMSIMPKELEQFIDSANLNDEAMAYDGSYKSFALNKASLEANIRYEKDPVKSPARYYELVVAVIGEWIKPERNKSVLISEFMPQVMRDVGTADLSSFVATLEKVSKDDKLIASVKKYASQYEHLNVGRIAPDAEFYDAGGKVSKLSDYRGKVLYIDTWATWCGPCKREIPYLKTLEESYHGKNVQFISVSTDKDVEAWKAFIAKETMSGLQLHQSVIMEKTMSYLYAVNSIPRFVLIDEEGKIVSVDAPRPSSGEEIRTLIDRVLND
jgi:thiol-disulfide isomerase/thioredoxin